MTSKYDVLYLIALKEKCKVSDIVKTLDKRDITLQTIFNKVLELEVDGYIIRTFEPKKKGSKIVKIARTEKTKKILSLITFCMKNKINYNIIFKDKMLSFLEKAAKKEFFTINDISIHHETFRFYVDALHSWGFLLVLSQKPLECKLLKHHFILDLLSFFGKKISFYSHKPRSFINQIKRELKQYKQNKKIHYSVLDKLEKKKEAHFIYVSLKLEGNPITLPDTQKLISDEQIPTHYKISHIHEVTNYKKAVDLMIENTEEKVLLDLDLILKYHKLAMYHIHGAGMIRKQNVKIKLNPHFKTTDWQLVPKKLSELMEKYEEFNREKKKVEEVVRFA